MGVMGAVSAGGLGAGALPAGTVTFLFTDLEGSTRLLEAPPADVTSRFLGCGRAGRRGSVASPGPRVPGARAARDPAALGPPAPARPDHGPGGWPAAGRRIRRVACPGLTQSVCLPASQGASGAGWTPPAVAVARER